MSSLDSMRMGLLLLVPLLGGCGGQDADRLARIGRKTMTRCDELTGGLRTRAAVGLDAVRANWFVPGPAPQSVPPSSTPPAAVAATPIDARVLWRIRWDKALAGADIQVHTPMGGVVYLRGTVNDLTNRRRAVELAETTDGVERVVDELGLQQP